MFKSLLSNNNNNNMTTMKTTGCSSDKKSVRINDKAQDLEQMHTARLTRKLRRMKRKLLLDAMADDPTNSGYSNGGSNNDSSSSLRMMMNNSSSWLRASDDDEDNDGEAAFRRGRMVRYHAPSGSMTFDSTSSVFSDLSQTELNEIHGALEERQDASSVCGC